MAKLPKGGLVFEAMIKQDEWEWLAIYFPGSILFLVGG